MKYLFQTCAIIFCILITSCGTNLKTFEKKQKYSDSNSVLGLNSINADNNYYTKSVLDYLFIKRIIDGNSLKYFGNRNHVEVGSVNDSIKVWKSVLFPQLQDFYKPTTPEEIQNIKDLKDLGLKDCTYDIPTSLEDLQSGFQFNHYVFKSSNRAAMQAFGIVDSEVKTQSLYIVTDYLQYLDVNCTEIPTIRYAVGMRAEFRILDVESETELKGIGSLAGLAAQVETNQQQVNITVKTIGITGIDSRISIPSNTTFDVKTYSDYESIINFIRNLKDYDTTYTNRGKLNIHPEIIPVMDDYRTTIAHSFHPLMETIEVLEAKIKDFEKDDEIDKNKIKEIRDKINTLKINLLESEVEQLIENRSRLIKSDSIVNDYSNILKIIEGLTKNKGLDEKDILKKLNGN
jgi:hypothetical protein